MHAAQAITNLLVRIPYACSDRLQPVFRYASPVILYGENDPLRLALPCDGQLSEACLIFQPVINGILHQRLDRQLRNLTMHNFCGNKELVIEHIRIANALNGQVVLDASNFLLQQY
ncbi:hypothetical protein D3C80_1485200 [compost metagenome]